MLANTRVRPSLKESRGDSGAKSKYRAASSILKRVSIAGRIVAPCYALLEERQREVVLTASQDWMDEAASVSDGEEILDLFALRKQQKQREQMTYQGTAIAASLGVSFLAIAATVIRFQWHMEADGDIPWAEVSATLLLVLGGVFGMEMWARYAHKSLWHEYAPGWALHKSHHEPRTGPFEDNDVFAIANGVPAMSLCLYGFLTPGMSGGLCFGAGLGITLFGIMYMFVHDGLVHRRFPVGPLADLPLMKKLAVAHQLHHAEKYDGAPWGMFLALQELEAIPGATEEVERLASQLDWSRR